MNDFGNQYISTNILITSPVKESCKVSLTQ